MAKHRKCLTRGCTRERQVRGLCESCWNRAKYRIRTGKVTEEKLIEIGMLLPSRVPTCAFDKQLSKALKKK